MNWHGSFNDIDNTGIDSYFIGSAGYSADVDRIIVNIYKKINKKILSFFTSHSEKYDLQDETKDMIFNEENIDINYLTLLFLFLMRGLRNVNKLPITDADVYFAVYSCAEICIKEFTDTNNISKITSNNAKNIIQKIINRLTHIYQIWKKLYQSYNKAATIQLGQNGTLISIQKNLKLFDNTNEIDFTKYNATFKDIKFALGGNKNKNVDVNKTVLNYINAYYKKYNKLPSVPEILQVITAIYGRAISTDQLKSILQYVKKNLNITRKVTKDGKQVDQKLEYTQLKDESFNQTILQSAQSQQVLAANGNGYSAGNTFRATITANSTDNSAGQAKTGSYTFKPSSPSASSNITLRQCNG